MSYDTFIKTFTNIPLDKFPKGYKTRKQKRGLDKLLVHWIDTNNFEKENKELQLQCQRKEKVIEELKRKLGVMTGTAEAQQQYLSKQAKKLGKKKKNQNQNQDQPTPQQDTAKDKEPETEIPIGKYGKAREGECQLCLNDGLGHRTHRGVCDATKRAYSVALLKKKKSEKQLSKFWNTPRNFPLQN